LSPDLDTMTARRLREENRPPSATHFVKAFVTPIKFSVSDSTNLDYLKVVTRALLRHIEELHSASESKEGFDLKSEVQNFEVTLIRSALEVTGGGQRSAARLLGIMPTTLHTKIRRYGIAEEESNEEDDT